MPRQVLITTYPRIHVTLIDLGNTTNRRYGGAGFSIDFRPTRVCVKPASENRLEFLADHIASRDHSELKSCLVRVSQALHCHFEISVLSSTPSHVGLGSKTILLLSVLIGCNATTGNLLSRKEIVNLSQRGGASGIGVNATFGGGFIVDGGHSRESTSSFQPSSCALGDFPIPPVLIDLSFPREWEIHLFQPKGRRFYGTRERLFFESSTPIPDYDVHNVLATVYHGLAPAIATIDFGLFKSSLVDIGAHGFKRREIEAQTTAVAELLSTLNDRQDVAAGMSSMGPLVYAVVDKSSETTIDHSKVFQSTFGSIYEGCCLARNQGYSCEPV